MRVAVLSLLLLLSSLAFAGPGLYVDITTPAAIAGLTRPDCRFCVLKLRTLAPDDVGRVKAWARKGGCVLVYDCHLAAQFGFTPRPCPIPPRAATTQTDFGDSAQALAVFGAVPRGHHPAVAGLNTLPVAAVLYPDGKVSAVAPGPDVTVLLTTSDPQQVVAAVRPLGRGAVVFKPFLMMEQGAPRFNSQLEQWFLTTAP